MVNIFVYVATVMFLFFALIWTHKDWKNFFEWVDCHNNQPNWTPETKYRLKPEEKDFEEFGSCLPGAPFKRTKDRSEDSNVKMTFDGKTKKLKRIEMI